jgi:hypothetical protein
MLMMISVVDLRIARLHCLTSGFKTTALVDLLVSVADLNNVFDRILRLEGGGDVFRLREWEPGYHDDDDDNEEEEEDQMEEEDTGTENE